MTKKLDDITIEKITNGFIFRVNYKEITIRSNGDKEFNYESETFVFPTLVGIYEKLKELFP